MFYWDGKEELWAPSGGKCSPVPLSRGGGPMIWATKQQNNDMPSLTCFMGHWHSTSHLKCRDAVDVKNPHSSHFRSLPHTFLHLPISSCDRAQVQPRRPTAAKSLFSSHFSDIISIRSIRNPFLFCTPLVWSCKGPSFSPEVFFSFLLLQDLQGWKIRIWSHWHVYI